MDGRPHAAIPNDAICSSIAKIYSAEIGDLPTTHIPFIIKKSNLSLPVVLGALYVALSAREKAGRYIERLNSEMEQHIFKRTALQKRIDECLLLFSDGSMLFAISLVLASKYLIDRSYVNKTWANILMMDVETVNMYERTLLHVFDHNVEITERALVRVLDRVVGGDKVGSVIVSVEKKEPAGCLGKLLKKVASCFSFHKQC